MKFTNQELEYILDCVEDAEYTDTSVVRLINRELAGRKRAAEYMARIDAQFGEQ